MPVGKGINNFARHQKDKVEYIKNRIDLHLASLRKSKAQFENLSTLSDYLCDRLTEDLRAKWLDEGKKYNEPKQFSKSTLYRNHNYRAKLDSFLASIPHGGTSTALAKTSLPMAQAKMSESQIEISNLKNKINILERYIENSGIEKSGDDKPKELTNENDVRIEFSQTARALSLLLEATEGQFIEQDGQIINAGKLVNNIVVDKRTLAAFIKWIKIQGENSE
jgi:cysteinyl-tRNA synthetase